MPVDLQTVGNDGFGRTIDPQEPKSAPYETMLENLQGNILKGHGRDNAVFLFVRFTETDQPSLRSAFGELALKYITSARIQEEWRVDYKLFGIPGSLFGNVFVSATGYDKLGMPLPAEGSEPGLPHPDPKQPPIVEPVDVSFEKGMHAARTELNDPEFEQWEKGYRTERSIDALFLIAEDDVFALGHAARALTNQIRQFAEIVATERGTALRDASGQGIEHFGYVDGRSQPLYLHNPKVDKAGVDEDGGTMKFWNPAEPLARVLIPDPAGQDGEDAHGSFFVFRKLEQNVRGFKKREQDLANALNIHREAIGVPPLTEEGREIAGASAVGRFEDGTPVALSPKDGFAPPRENDFTYAVDPNAAKCPFQAHIRKMNPRGDILRKALPNLPPGIPLPSTPVDQENALERSRRITRRGIPYGKPIVPSAVPLDELPTFSEGEDTSGAVGLLFMCFQASIAQQFGFMQKSWANNAAFVTPSTGLDSVIGQKGDKPEPIPVWPAQYGIGGGVTAAFDMSGFVRMKGGEFFFAPSLPFFRRLQLPNPTSLAAKPNRVEVS